MKSFIHRIIKDEKGITLIEIIIVLAISSIILTTTLSVFNFGNNVFAKGNEQYDIQSDVRIVSDYIQNQVRYATSMQLITSIPPATRGDLDEDDLANDVFGLEYIVLENDRIVHYIIDDNVDEEGNLLSTDPFQVKYTFANTLPGTSFESSSSNELVYVVNASDRPGNYALRSLIYLANYSIHEGLFVEKYGEESEETVGIRFTRDSSMLAGLSGGVDIVNSVLIPKDWVGLGPNDKQKEKAVRITFSNGIKSVDISAPLEFKIENSSAVEIRHKTNAVLPVSFEFEVTDVKDNTIRLTVTRNGSDYDVLVQ